MKVANNENSTPLVSPVTGNNDGVIATTKKGAVGILSAEPPHFSIKISTYYEEDYTDDQLETQGEFLSGLKQLPFYKEGLLYCGIKNATTGMSYSSTQEPGTLFASLEEAFLGSLDDPTELNPLAYITDGKNPAILVYDPAQLTDGNTDNQYRLIGTNPCIAIIHLQLR